MFGNKLKSGPEALSFGNTLFRISEISWIKAQGLTLPEKIVKGVLLVLGVAFIWAMQVAKGTYFNVEWLLAALPLHLAYLISSDLRLASTGDIEETYEERVGRSRGLFNEWVENLSKRNPDWIHLKGQDYAYLINPDRIAWVRSKVQVSFYPLAVGAIFYAYHFVTGLDLDFETTPIVSDLRMLTFEPGQTGLLVTMCYLVVVASLAAFAVSIKRSLELCAPGGVFDSLRVSAEDEAKVLLAISGTKTAAEKMLKTPALPVKKPVPAEKPAPVETKVEAKPAPTPTPKTPQPAATEG